MLDNDHEVFTEANVAQNPVYTSEILVSAATVLVFVLSVYLTLFDSTNLF